MRKNKIKQFLRCELGEGFNLSTNVRDGKTSKEHLLEMKSQPKSVNGKIFTDEINFELAGKTQGVIDTNDILYNSMGSEVDFYLNSKGYNVPLRLRSFDEKNFSIYARRKNE